jgi:hypothetical protein
MDSRMFLERGEDEGREESHTHPPLEPLFVCVRLRLLAWLLGHRKGKKRHQWYQYLIFIQAIHH